MAKLTDKEVNFMLERKDGFNTSQLAEEIRGTIGPYAGLRGQQHLHLGAADGEEPSGPA